MAIVLVVALSPLGAEARSCLAGTAAEQDADAAELRATIDAVDAACPCTSYPAGQRRAFETCVAGVIGARTRAATIGRRCAVVARRIVRESVCGRTTADPQPCIRGRAGRLSCRIEPRRHCVVNSLGPSLESLAVCPAFTRCLEAADTDGDLRIARPGDSGACAGPRCGDGAIDPGEECDDGNTIPFDGCSATCRTEVDCNPDGTWPLAEPIEYSCTTVGPGELPFQRTINRIVLSDHGRSIDVLGAPGSLPPGTPLSCAGSPIDRIDAMFTPNECFFVAHVIATFTDPATVDPITMTGTITLSHENGAGSACTPSPLFNCPPVTLPFTATRE